MAWAKFDDDFWCHPKVRATVRRDDGAIGLFVRAVTLSCRYETDGRIRPYDLEELCIDPQRRETLVSILVEQDLFDRLDTAEAIQAAQRNLELVAKEVERKHPVRAGSARELAEAIGDKGPHGDLLIHDFLIQNKSKAEILAGREKDADKKAEQRSRRPRVFGGGEAQPVETAA